MSHRAAVILVENNCIALMERWKAGQHYFAIPGGHIEPGETPAQAAARECEEELGLKVEIRRLAMELWWDGDPHYYFLADVVGGTFGSGTGEEMRNPPPEKGKYLPRRVPLAELPGLPLMPPPAGEALLELCARGWQASPLILRSEA